MRAAALVSAASAALIVTALTPAHASEPTIDHIVSADPANFTPNVNQGKVDAMVQIGSRIIAVGKFTSVTAAASAGGATYTRNSIFAFNATTGVIDTAFAPNVGTKEVFDIVDAGDGTVYIGGLIAKVNGTKSNKVARINATTGALISTFKAPTINGAVNDMQLSGGRLYIAGGFTTIGGQPRTLLAALNPTTGADTGSVAFTFTDPWNGGALGIKHFDISDNGSTLVAVGNFRSVNGQSRQQIMMADLTGPSATLSGWSTDRYTTQCAGVFDTYMRDVDIDPSGGYFVVAATGAYSGGVGSGTLCDTVTRWELGATTGGQNPTWVDYSGGDTFTQVKATGAAIYVGGHFRWLNNPYASDAAGAGSVSREGIAAVDPRNGLPFSWNPTRARGVGVWEFMTTSDGLWVGHDTNQTGHEARKRIALFPSPGGTAIPTENTGSLPGDVYLLGQPASVTSGHWVARVNAAGPTLLANDNGPDWSADTGDQPSSNHNSNSNAADWGDLPISRGANLPSSTPTAIFSTERWSPNDSPNMQWDFPAPVGDSLTVRLYFSNGYSGTSTPGQRVFDVALDGATVLDNYDIVADTGNQTGTMKAFDITSDGNVDIDFSHVVENPLVNGIEIIDNSIPAPGPTANDTVIDRDFTGSTVTGSQTVGNGGQSWSSARGAVMIDNTLYTGWSDGTLKARTYNGTTFGAATNVNLNGLTQFANEIPNITGMFYDKTTARLYYSLAGQSQLYYRYFQPESRTVGAVEFAGPANGNGLDFRNTSGLLLDGGSLYVGNSTNGNLATVGWSNGQLTGTATAVSGPGIDGYDWRARGAFVYAG
ncbi:MAG TPA: malectin domain-containing carbohydrate-binding protein [Nocardioidaceae bacterium]|nr:malectin domain-containing carbohydrate-binding protein [Nocardioidaceae bacterium]